MENYKKIAFKKAAEGIIKNLERGQMNGYYFDSSEECVSHILSMIPENSVISWGGSETIKECGLLDKIKAGNYQTIDRSTAKNPQEARELFSKIVLSDYYLMSSNAITLNGELVNIDGAGNRVACLIHGPEHVFVIVGMNKLVTDVDSGYKRVKDIVAPANAQRLQKTTPCAVTGHCGNCYAQGSMCSHTVITRRCSQKGRISVFLVGEELGY